MSVHRGLISALAPMVAFIAIFVVDIPTSHCQTLHVVSAADTRDPQMGIEFGLNNAAIQKYVDALAQTINFKLDLTDISGSSYSCASIQGAVNNLQVGSKDIIIFFHSGHGHSPRRDVNDPSASIYPALECASALDQPTLNLEDLFKIMVGKKARLTIVAADSCNNIVPAPQQKLAPAVTSSSLVQTMYLQYEGSILMASSAPGEFSFYPDKSIGYFTKQFIDALSNPPGVKANLIWEQVIARAAAPIALPIHQPPQQDAQHPPHREELRYMPP